ncbi:MAG TPA: AtpZ/AtpI family protein [Symbiobacteriaceae bacterium]|nr:AtpZ/AtpI family protein [Symbiobacteriaceae bacterium]
MFKRTRERSPYFLLAMDFGYTLLAAILLFGFIGWYVDNRYSTAPWFMLAGGGLGLAVGFNSLFRKLNLLESKRKAARKQDTPEEETPGRQPR